MIRKELEERLEDARCSGTTAVYGEWCDMEVERSSSDTDTLTDTFDTLTLGGCNSTSVAPQVVAEDDTYFVDPATGEKLTYSSR